MFIILFEILYKYRKHITDLNHTFLSAILECRFKRWASDLAPNLIQLALRQYWMEKAI